jgi:acetoin utilization deacetylase AcuC-like enzyme
VLKQHGTEVNYLEYDVYANKYTYEAALMAAGACVEACDSMIRRLEVDSVFAAVRPPGHHADENIS